MKDKKQNNITTQKKPKLSERVIAYFNSQSDEINKKLTVKKSIVSVIMESDCNSTLKGDNPCYMISVDNENRYDIKNIPILVHYKSDDIQGEIAYDYDTLNQANKEKFKDVKRTFIKGEDGFFYQEVREYSCKRKINKK